MSNSTNEPRRPTFSILHTSARPDKWQEIHDAWMSTAEFPDDVEYILVVDEKWGFNALAHMELEAPLGKGKLLWAKQSGYVVNVNLAASHSTGDILIVIADDQYPASHWDTAILSGPQPSGNPLTCGVWALQANTGTPDEFSRHMLHMPIMSRELYAKWGYVFYPLYESMYADNDAWEKAFSEAALIQWEASPVFPHRHPLFHASATWDAVYAAQNRSDAYSLGERLLAIRRSNNFTEVSPSQINPVNPGLKLTMPGMPQMPKMPHIRALGLAGKLTQTMPTTQTTQSSQASLPTEVAERKRIVVCLPGEKFSSSWVAHWSELYAFLLSRFVVLPYFVYTSNCYATRAVLVSEIRKLDPAPDYVLWIDDDNTPTSAQILQLQNDLDSNSELAGVCAWAFTAADSHEADMHPSVGHFRQDWSVEWMSVEHMNAQAGDLLQVDCSGFPTVLMRGETLTLMGDRPFMPYIDESYDIGFCGEDVSFFRRAKRLNLLFAVDRRIRVPHLKLRDARPSSPVNEFTSNQGAVPISAA